MILVEYLFLMYYTSNSKSFCFCKAQTTWPITICSTFNSSPRVNFNQSLNSSFPLVSFQILCSSDGLPVPEGAQPFSEVSTRIPACKPSQLPCPSFVSSLCTIYAVDPPGFGNLFSIRRWTTGSEFATNHWELEILRPLQCKLDDNLISISIKCGL